MCNLSIVGQLLRVTLGLLLIALAWYGPQTTILSKEWIELWALGWFGLIPLISGILAFCPLYAVLGYNYYNKQNR
jgi:hypothetical protein